MSNKLYEESHIQNIANAIREKNGKTSQQYKVSQMADAIKAIETSENDLLETIIEGTAIEIKNDNIKNINNYVFKGQPSLTQVNFPACETIGVESFADCSNLTSINFPECINVGTRAFYSCSNISEVYMPKCISIDSNAFCYGRDIKSISFPLCEYIGNGAFFHCNI